MGSKVLDLAPHACVEPVGRTDADGEREHGRGAAHLDDLVGAGRAGEQMGLESVAFCVIERIAEIRSDQAVCIRPSHVPARGCPVGLICGSAPNHGGGGTQPLSERGALHARRAVLRGCTGRYTRAAVQAEARDRQGACTPARRTRIRG
jgi:hypothetical protein